MIAELRKLVSPELLFEVTRQTRESDSGMAKAYDAAIPACAATIANRSDDHRFMTQLVDLATGADPDPIQSAVRLASGPGIDTTAAATAWLSSLFGRNLSGVITSLARYAGIRESSASSLLMTCAPLVLGYLGRLIRSHSLDATGLAERLRMEQPQIASALPAGFEMPGIGRKTYETTRAVVDDTTRWPEHRWETWTSAPMPLAAVLVIGGLIWGWQGFRHREMERTIDNAAPNAVGTTGTLDRPRTGALPQHLRFAFPAGSIEDRLSRYLESAGGGSMKVNLDRVGFERGSSTLTPQSRRQVENLAAILRAYPRATVVVAGHTDNIGSEADNLALSRARAKSVARALTNAGVAADRVRAEGYGSQQPVADNSTEDGRSQNRRVTLDVSR